MAHNKQEEIAREELKAAYSGPALYSNRFIVAIKSPVVRITFTEKCDPESAPAYRTAVVLTLEDGIELSKLLQRLLKQNIEPQIETSQKHNG